MKAKYRLLSLVLALSMAFSALGGISLAADAYEGKLVILHTNDVHTRVDTNIGYAGVAAAKQYFESQGAEVILLDAGDTLHGLPLANMTDGSAIVEIMNAVGYDAMAPGNHDFNYGTKQLITLSELMDFPLLSANFTDKAGELVFASNALIELEGFKIGIVGLTTPETRYKTTPAYVADYDFSDDNLAEVLQANIDDLKEQGADYIIALGHLGIDAESAPWRSIDVIPKVSGLNAFIDGHSHSTLTALAEANAATVKDKDGNEVLLTSTGEYLTNLGMIVYDGTSATAAYVDMEGIEPDGEIAALIAEMRAAEDAELNTIIGNVPFTLVGDRAYVRTQETNFGDLSADAIRNTAKSDVAISNGGGIRTTLPIDHTDPESPEYVEGAKAGDITMKDVLTVFPYFNTIAVIEISGETLLQALEHGTSTAPTGQSGGFPQISGATFTLHAYREENRVTDVMVNGQALDLKKTYTLACNNFMATGGDGYVMFEDKPYVSEHGLDYEPLLDYIAEDMNGTVSDQYAKSQGRIKIIRFPDIAIGSEYYEAVDAVANSGLMGDCGDGNFAPEVTINRAMAITLLYRLAEKPEITGKATDYFTDVEDGVWYSDALVWAAQNDVCSTDETVFAPYETLTRTQFAQFMRNFVETDTEDTVMLTEWETAAPDEAATRGEVARIISA